MPRRHFTTSLDERLLKAIKKLAIDLDRSVNDLLEEGIRYLLEKHEKQSDIATSRGELLDESKFDKHGEVKRVVKRPKEKM
jgi:hypothetical protein